MHSCLVKNKQIDFKTHLQS